MKRSILFLAAVVIGLALAAALQWGAASVLAAPLAANNDPQAINDDPQAPPPPQKVSPADPSIDPPDAGRWVCPRCGAEVPGPVWRHKGRFGGPQLGAGPGWGADRRPGRWGRDGERGDRGAGRWDIERGYGPRGMGMARGMHRGMGRGMDRGMAPGYERGPRAGRGPGYEGVIGQGPRMGGATEMMLRHSKELKLTEEQIDKLETLASDTRMKLIDLRAEVAKGELEIANLIRSGSDDMARIKSHLDAVSSARSKIAELRITNLFEARKVLTPEQKKQVKDEFPRLRPMLD